MPANTHRPYITAPSGKPNRCINNFCEICDFDSVSLYRKSYSRCSFGVRLTCVFEQIMHNLHDTTSMLYNGHFGTFMHFQSAKLEAIDRLYELISK